jgi:hypothetical protein
MEEVARVVAPDADPSAGADALRAYLRDKWSVRLGQATCTVDEAPMMYVAEDRSALYTTGFRCPIAGPLTLSSAAFFDVSPSHTILARVFKADVLLEEFAFTSSTRSHIVDPATAPRSDRWVLAVLRFLRIGIEHILTGPDHLAFVAGLMLAASSFRVLLMLTSGFTLGHSVTLALASTDRIISKASLVEGLVAFTILLVAVDVLRSRTKMVIWPIITCLSAVAISYCVGPPLPLSTAVSLYGGLTLVVIAFLRLRATATRLQLPLQLGVTTVFGLVHGMAFASGLRELDVKGASILPPLVGFNLGIEVGQLLFIGCIASFAWLCAKLVSASVQEKGATVAAASLSAAAAWWFVSRMA